MPDQKEKTLSESSSTRWWDFYFVRYCMGTIVGSLLVMAALSAGKKDGSGSKLDFFGSVYELLKIGDYGLVMLPIIGLAYCYFASAPILVLHACRSAIVKIREGQLLAAMMLVPALFAVMIWAPWFHEKLVWIAVSSLGIVLLGQALCIYCSIDSRKVQYKKLSKKKAEAKLEEKEFIESYKHLREHGNAFMIVMMEVLLAVILYAAPSTKCLTAVLALWAFPAAYVWFIGNYLEKTLTE